MEKCSLIRHKENNALSFCGECTIFKLKENIKCLEEVSINLNQKIKELKIIFDKIEKNKEELKTNIQKIFTKLRNVLNDRDDKLLTEVDNKYNEFYFLINK